MANLICGNVAVGGNNNSTHDNIVHVTEIKEGGTYRDDDYNSYFVNCLLKDGRTIEFNFSYKEESDNG